LAIKLHEQRKKKAGTRRSEATHRLEATGDQRVQEIRGYT